MGCGTSLDAAPLAMVPNTDSSEGGSLQGRSGTARAVAPSPAPAPAPTPAAITAPTAPKGAAEAEWLRAVAAREQKQAVWAKDENGHWEVARDAAMAAAAGAPDAGGAVVAPPLLRDGAGATGGASPAVPESDELAALMCGRLVLPSLQHLSRPPGLAVFCSSTVRRGHGGDSSVLCFHLDEPKSPWASRLHLRVHSARLAYAPFAFLAPTLGSRPIGDAAQSAVYLDSLGLWEVPLSSGGTVGRGVPVCKRAPVCCSMFYVETLRSVS